MKRISDFEASESLQYHLDNGLPLAECVYMIGSDSYCKLHKEVRELYESGDLLLEDARDKAIAKLKTGDKAIYKGKKVKLHLPMYDKTAGKKLKVYLETGRTDKETGLPVAKVLRFGDPNLSIKNHDKEAADSFQARQKCDSKSDINKAGFWACNIHIFAKQLGLKSSYPW